MSFFSRANIHNFIWAIIGAFVLFLCSQIWGWWNGPEEVKIINSKVSSKDTVITIIKFDPNQFNDDDEETYKKTSNNQKSNYKIDPILANTILNSTLSDNNRVENKIISSNSNKENIDNFASTFRPKFKLPNLVSGYTSEKVNSFASIQINKNIFNQNDFIEINTTFLKNSTINKISPLIVDIVKRKNQNSSYQIWSEQYKINDKENIVKISSNFPPDIYEISVGFYFLDELNLKYPKFYSESFSITIK